MRQTDPQKVGEWLLAQRKQAKNSRWIRWSRDEKTGTSICEIADHIPWDKLPTLPRHTSMQATAQEEYLKEITEAAAQGDKYAKRVLETILPGD